MSISLSTRIATRGLVSCIDTNEAACFGGLNLPIDDGLILWLDAADEATIQSKLSGGSLLVSEWRDKSPLKNHCAQSTDADKPSFDTEGVLFSGSQFLTSASNISFERNKNLTVFIAARKLVGGDQSVIGLGSNAAGQLFDVLVTSDKLVAAFNGSDTTTGAPSITTGNTFIGSFSYNGSNVKVYKDGTQAVNSAFSLSTAASTALIGASKSATNPEFSGYVYEVLIYNRLLSDAERSKIHTYLGNKWEVAATDSGVFDLAYRQFLAAPALTFLNSPKSINFSGTGSEFQFKNSALINNLQFTFDCTLYYPFTQRTYRKIFSQGFNNWSSGLCFEVYNNSIGISIGSGSQATSISVHTDPEYSNRWINAIVTCDGQDIRIYINGQPAILEKYFNTAGTLSVDKFSLAIPDPNSLSLSAASSWIGGRGTASNQFMYQGLLSALRIYDRALSEEEVKKNYQSVTGRLAKLV